MQEATEVRGGPQEVTPSYAPTRPEPLRLPVRPTPSPTSSHSTPSLRTPRPHALPRPHESSHVVCPPKTRSPPDPLHASVPSVPLVSPEASHYNH